MSDLDFLNNIESDYKEYKKEERKRTNSKNKARSRAQEQKVAKFLGASRVPMSGAGMLKGDGIWNTPLGLAVYECKYSAGMNPTYGPSLRFQYTWLEKLQRDVESMKARFGFLVFTYYNQVGGIQWSPTFVNPDVAAMLMKPEWMEAAFEYKPTAPSTQGYISAFVYYKEIRNLFMLNRVFPSTFMLTPHGRYDILPLWAIKQRVDDLTNDISGIPAS